MNERPPRLLQIGELARKSGVSAKALRLYERRGLLKPDGHSPAGYRLYGAPALAELMRVVTLRRSGFTLAEIGHLLQGQPGATAELLQRRIDALERELSAKAQVLATLRAAQRRSRSSSPDDIESLLESIAMTHTLDIDLTPAERAAFIERAERLGEAGLQAAQNAWPELIAEVRAAMQAGLPATDAGVVALGRRWHALVQAATGGDAAVNHKLASAWRDQPQAMAAQGMDLDMFRYVGAAMAAAGLSLFGGTPGKPSTAG